MALNGFASRSYKDLTQYPVFPWVLTDYTSESIDLLEEKLYRDLNRPMGAHGNEERLKVFKERFETNDPFSPVPPFHYGSHYSNPAIIMHFLVRLPPFTDGVIALQNGKFDLPDRLFFCVRDSFRGATEEISDVRELTPEFYCLPEIFMNLNGLDFGHQQNGDRVHHVVLPAWAHGNPFEFVRILRIALESDYVSNKLANWIDLIFGYKQRGKDAEEAQNVFYYLTYEDKAGLDKVSDHSQRVSMEAQVVHFGQTPSQLFTEKQTQSNGSVIGHPQKQFYCWTKHYRIISDHQANLRIFRPARNGKLALSMNEFVSFYSAHFPQGVLHSKLTRSSRLVVLKRDGSWSTFTFNGDAPSEINHNVPFICSIEKERKLLKLDKFENLPKEFDVKGRIPSLTRLDLSLEVMSYPMAIIQEGKVYDRR
jgi:hypothetical protein